MFTKELSESLEPLLFLLIVEGISDRYTRAEREYIFAKISEDNNCSFCYDIHYSLALQFKITDEQKKNIENILSGPLDNETESIVHFCHLANGLESLRN
jgi:AhpD family alkylhydroperoxidase|tara:strand:- start:136 stop:432 length:297 start_codon:yes stop_codon:yes gene_type:complete